MENETFDTNDLRCTGEEYGARTMVNLNGVSAPETSPGNEEGLCYSGASLIYGAEGGGCARRIF